MEILQDIMNHMEAGMEQKLLISEMDKMHIKE